jgi:hypothetical protein|tara:strand:- start:1041 stop:2156 length:1116 start_codon:yes stop_codon:yes gene_type:complete
MTITLRQTTQAGATNKGSSLTFAEMDNTVIDLLTNKIQAIQVDADSTNASVGLAQGTGVLEIKGGTNITTAIAADSAGTATLTITGTTFLANLTDDSSPQLAGNLDVNGNKIITASGNANLKLSPHGSGVVEIEGDGASEDGTIQLNCSANSHGIKLASPPHSAGQSYTLTFPSTSPNANDFIVTNANGDLSFVKLSAGTGITISNPDSAGDFVITNTVSAGISDVVSDTSPQLGGNLDVQTNSIVSTSNRNISISPNGTGQTKATRLQYDEDIHDLGTTSGTITPNVDNGNVQTITLNNNLTLNALASATSGQSLTLIITQDGTGGRTLSSTMKFAGGAKTLSTAASAVDIMTVFYDGSNYWASLSTNFS